MMVEIEATNERDVFTLTVRENDELISKIKGKRLLIIWSEPYEVTHSIECEGTINDPNRSFSDWERQKMNSLEIGGLVRLAGFMVYRIR